MAYLRKNVGTVTGIVTQEELDAADDRLQTNVAMIAFRQAVDHNDAKYDLQDQIVDEYYSNAGIDTGASTFEVLAAGVYYGVDPTGGDTTPTVTEDADVGPTVDGDYTWYKWTDTGSTGSYNTNTTQDHEFLVVAGGGGAGGVRGGGGGAGGLRTSYGSASGGSPGAVQTDVTLVGGTTYTITVGAGGSAGPSSGGAGYGGGNGGS